ncbi:hypothetical protein PRIPAC_81941 [Pristionchus pacificus]|uniref:G protein-coupled receptor n=1 Tax=Pristionchus pacificus TaxID=54126 RepID=A0A2A6CLL7_PRIPA|nr:hypothetical protein PRIPAC_81941 [Pristionchus pacificus]|eukprot:PDM79092.1 G protein-coupled receptor [Pristionchus pacificus]
MQQLTPLQFLISRASYILLALVAAFGAVSNFSLFVVTVRTKSLRSTCHILIGFCAVLDGIHQIGPFFLSPMLFADQPIENAKCSLLMGPIEIGLLGGTTCVMCIGLERMTAIIFVSFYKKISRIRHLFLHLLLIVCFAGYACYLMIAYFNPGIQMCSIIAPFHSEAADLFVSKLILVNTATIVIYTITAIAIAKKSDVSPYLRRAFNCLFVVMLFDVGRWAMSIGSLTISLSLEVTEETHAILAFAAGIFVHVGIASKALIYYSISDEYRKAFRNVFGNRLPNVKFTGFRVHFSPTLSFSYHISKVVLKARTKMNLMFKSFHSKCPIIYSKAFTTFILPSIEYCSIIWNPTSSVKLTKELERVQRDFTRRLYSRCGLPPVSYSERLRDLKFTTLEQRRFVTDIVFLHSIIHKRYLLDVSSLLITAPLNRTLRNGQPLRIALPFLPHNSQSTLASRAISTWNSLESSSVALPHDPFRKFISSSLMISPMQQLTPLQFLISRASYILLALVAAFGAVSNFSLFVVTVRTKSLRSTCHILIGFCALLDGIHQIGPFFLSPMLFADQPIENAKCSLLMGPIEIGLLGGTTCVMCIGLERMTAIIFVSFYKKISRIRHLFLHLLLIVCFAGYACYLMIAYFNPGIQMCSIIAPFHSEAADLFVSKLILVNTATIVIYTITAIAIAKKSDVSPYLRRAFNCLFVVMLFDVGRWAMSIGSLTISLSLEVTEETHAILAFAAGIFVHVGIASKALIYYSISDEYRKAFRNVFGNRLPNVKFTGFKKVIVKDLGVHFSPTLSFSYHISKVVLKARTKMNLMFKSFHSKCPIIYSKAFTTFILPSIEYCSIIWNPTSSVKLTKELERVQRDFTRRLYSRCGLPPVSYSERLRDLKFTTLEQRRFVTDIVFLHSIIHKRYLLDVSSLLITAPLNRTLRNGQPLRIALPFLPHNSQSTLASRAISTWNSLESSSVALPHDPFRNPGQLQHYWCHRCPWASMQFYLPANDDSYQVPAISLSYADRAMRSVRWPSSDPFEIGPVMLSPLLILDKPISNPACNAIMVLPEVGLLCGTACVRCIGVERLTANCLPGILQAHFAHGTSSARVNIRVLYTSLFPLHFTFNLVFKYAENIRYEAAQLFVSTLGLVNLSTVAVYSITTIVIRRRSGDKSSQFLRPIFVPSNRAGTAYANSVSPSLRRALHCIFLVMIFDVGGWALSVGALTFSLSLDVTAYRHAFRSVFGNKLPNVRQTVNSAPSETTITTFYGMSVIIV